MAKYNVDYYESYQGTYTVDAENELDAQEIVREMIREGKLQGPETCVNSWSKASPAPQVYKVKIVETYERVVRILANDPDHADEITHELVDNGCIDIPLDGKGYDYNREIYVQGVADDQRRDDSNCYKEPE